MPALPAFESPPLLIRRDAARTAPTHNYQVAGLGFTVDQPLPQFNRFRHAPACSCPAPTKTLPGSRSPEAAGDSRWRGDWKRSTRGLVGSRVRTVTATGSSDAMSVEVEGLGSFEIDRSGRLGYPLSMGAAQLAEALCGPLLPLALSQRDSFCLHGAALRHRRGLTLLLGASGVGKSTLSRALADSGAALWADDTVAVTCTKGGPLCPGHYPQPKWPGWRSAVEESRCAITHVVVLSPGDHAKPAMTSLSPAAATLALVEHTVAGRLFSPTVLRRHLKFAAAVARKAVCCQIDYPQRPAALPAMVRCLRRLSPWP